AVCEHARPVASRSCCSRGHPSHFGPRARSRRWPGADQDARLVTRRRLLAGALAGLSASLFPMPVFASNCSSLSDCWDTIAAAVVVVVAVAIIIAIAWSVLPVIGLEVAGEAGADPAGDA